VTADKPGNHFVKSDRDVEGVQTMKFDKVSEQNAWDAVAEATRMARAGELESRQLLEWFSHRGVDLEQAVFPCIVPFDDGIYSGTLVDQDRRVIEYFVDLSAPDDGEFDDVTGELGPKDPSHPASDVKDLITMALVYFDEHQTQAA